ncbi:hypothetical protein LUZ61_008649 [Rhynchospora tenuis]|uniref:ZF-HD dimerization-type domain-containing protein n=1 Tax=Rhynchospora tenuis TaxID=198213 RepID=A0AAD5ZVR1_9POAL|nr:hypothetical protein LUZ61_008649 [Rhynchospora tenuis]
MDFDDHDEAEEEEEEMGIPPVGPGYQPPPIMPNSTGPKPLSSAPGPEPMPGPGPRKAPSGGGRYRECLKNHALGIGGHAVDGCGEFMAAGDEGTIDALRCAACNCHRNFHRKEADGGGGPGPSAIAPGAIVDPSTTYHQPHPQFSPYYRTPAGYLHHHHMAAAAAAAAGVHRPVPLALPSTSGGGHSRDEGEDVSLSHPMGLMGLGGSPGVMMGMGASGSGSGSGSGKKRFRTKFTQEQKDKMLAFAEKVGWRIQKHDEQAVQQFCNEVAVKRHVLKVWMHNNKHTLGKKP